jgi:hypothetical protein
MLLPVLILKNLNAILLIKIDTLLAALIPEFDDDDIRLGLEVLDEGADQSVEEFILKRSMLTSDTTSNYTLLRNRMISYSLTALKKAMNYM